MKISPKTNPLYYFLNGFKMFPLWHYEGNSMKLLRRHCPLTIRIKTDQIKYLNKLQSSSSLFTNIIFIGIYKIQKRKKL